MTRTDVHQGGHGITVGSSQLLGSQGWCSQERQDDATASPGQRELVHEAAHKDPRMFPKWVLKMTVPLCAADLPSVGRGTRPALWGSRSAASWELALRNSCTEMRCAERSNL